MQHGKHHANAVNIAIDAREFVAGRQTGIARYLENLLIPLVGHPELHLTLLTHDAHAIPATLKGPNVKHQALPAHPTQLVDQVHLPAAAGRAGATVFFSPHYKIPFAGTFRRIITVHDTMFIRLSTASYAHRLASHLQLSLSLKSADAILVDSKHTGKELAQAFPTSARKTHVIYPPLDTGWMEPHPAETIGETRSKYSNGQPFFLYVGNFKPHKRVDLLIRAFAQSRHEPAMTGHRLVLAGGDSQNNASIAALVTTLGISERVRILHNVSDADLTLLYQTAEAFITTTSDEGFGYPVAEAMAHGCPVICPRCTSLPEVAGNAAYYMADPVNIQAVSKAMLDLAGFTSDEWATIAESSRQQSERFMGKGSSDAFAKLLLAKK